MCPLGLMQIIMFEVSPKFHSHWNWDCKIKRQVVTIGISESTPIITTRKDLIFNGIFDREKRAKDKRRHWRDVQKVIRKFIRKFYILMCQKILCVFDIYEHKKQRCVIDTSLFLLLVFVGNAMSLDDVTFSDILKNQKVIR